MNSILITHRNMWDYLNLCLRTIYRSAECTGRSDWEVVIVDHGSVDQRSQGESMDPRVRIVVDTREMPMGEVLVGEDGLALSCKVPFDPEKHRKEQRQLFCKAALWNRAIDEARGDVLTFLDCDMLVGPTWLVRAACFLDGPSPPVVDRVCYRVATPAVECPEGILKSTDPFRRIDWLFENFDNWPRAYEAWGAHDRDHYDAGAQPWGNAMFSIRRDRLGDIRFCEEFVGHGFEDLDMLAQLQRKFGPRYRGHLSLRPEDNLVHLPHVWRWDWFQDSLQGEGHRLYRQRNADLLGK